MVGRIARYSGPNNKFLINQRVGRFEINKPKELDARYLFYALSQEEYQWQLVSIATGSANQVNISGKQIESLTVPLPPISYQTQIANILGAIDDKIELNYQMNETLEAIALAIFKSWFVDFEPVRAKMEGRKFYGMDTEAATLFPSGFEASALGEIPVGWQIASLKEVMAFILGGDWGSDVPTSEATKATLCIRGADIPDLQNAGIGKMPLRYLKASSIEKRHLLSGDIVIEISGGSPTQSTGRPVLITEELQKSVSYPLICSNFCRMLRVNANVPTIYISLASMVV